MLVSLGSWTYSPSNTSRSGPSEMFLVKDVLKICSKCTGEHPCRSAILIKFLCNFIEIALRHGYCPVNLLHIFRTLLPKNTSGGCFCTSMLGKNVSCSKSSAIKTKLFPLPQNCWFGFVNVKIKILFLNALGK